MWHINTHLLIKSQFLGNFRIFYQSKGYLDEPILYKPTCYQSLTIWQVWTKSAVELSSYRRTSNRPIRAIIIRIHGPTDTRTLYTDLLDNIIFWKLEKYTDPIFFIYLSLYFDNSLDAISLHRPILKCDNVHTL